MATLSRPAPSFTLFGRTPTQALTLVLAAALLAAWLGLALWANLDASAARHMLFMDELITHDGVQLIYDAESPVHAVRAAMENEQRYGRTTFYLSYVTSTIGDAFAGEQGRIVANRMGFALVTCAAICMLSWTMLETAWGRLVGLAVGLTVPMASYYATMPKPDPLMLLFMALYFFSWKRSGNPFGYAMIWLGLSFGTKIAAFPALAMIIPLVFAQAWLTNQRPSAVLLKKSALSFLAGFLIAVPIILSSFPRGFSYYLQQTWMNRHHSLDVPGTGIADWMGVIISSAFFGDGLATLAVMAVFSLLILGALWLAAGRPARFGEALHAAGTLAQSPHFITVTATIAGAAMLGAIVVSTDRLWLFYLFPGAVLVTLGAVSSLEKIARSGSSLSRTVRFGSVSFGSLACAATAMAGAQFLHKDFEDLAHRSTTERFVQSKSVYEALVREADTLVASDDVDLPIRVAFSAHFWHPTTTENTEYLPFYHAFWHWPMGLDLVALGPEHMDRQLTPAPEREDATRYEGERLLPLHTDIGGPCTLAPCYRQILTGAEADGLFLFARDEDADDHALSSETSSTS